MGKISLPYCPLCQNNTHTLMRKRYKSNGVFGPGSYSVVEEFTFYCGVHGILFLDIRKEASANFADYEEDTAKISRDKYLDSVKDKLRLE